MFPLGYIQGSEAAIVPAREHQIAVGPDTPMPGPLRSVSPMEIE